VANTVAASRNEVVGFCYRRVVDGVFEECPAAILGSLIPLAVGNPNLLCALNATCRSLLEFSVRAAETKQIFLGVFDEYLPRLLPVMDENNLIALASVFAAFADADEPRCRRLFGRLARSRMDLSEDIREWLRFGDFVVPGEIAEQVGDRGKGRPHRRAGDEGRVDGPGRAVLPE
jgi:hypothetical protein